MQRYKIIYGVDENGDQEIRKIVEFKDIAGNILNPPTTTLSTDAGFAALLASLVQCEPTSITQNVSLISQNGDGNQSTASGLAEVSISNVGTIDATVDGVNFPPGASVTYTAYFDHVTNEFKRIDSISYNDNGSTLLIATTP